MIDLFHKTSRQCSKITAENYSTSFAAAVRLLHKNIRPDIYSIYGFVRFADEIVDTFHNYNKEALFHAFKTDTYKAIEEKISLNPILNSFQLTINKHNIDVSLIDAFFNSMQCDLDKTYHSEISYREYIYGSAESVGLMCLHIFCSNDKKLYDQLKEYAKRLGAAFQKVNFLRDIKADNEQLNRMYFPNCCFKNFSTQNKQAIEADIQQDFDYAFKGILLLPAEAKLGVYIAYKYYLCLFKKIKRLPPKAICRKRIRLADHIKIFILAKAGLQHRLNIL